MHRYLTIALMIFIDPDEDQSLEELVSIEVGRLVVLELLYLHLVHLLYSFVLVSEASRHILVT